MDARLRIAAVAGIAVTRRDRKRSRGTVANRRHAGGSGEPSGAGRSSGWRGRRLRDAGPPATWHSAGSWEVEHLVEPRVHHQVMAVTCPSLLGPARMRRRSAKLTTTAWASRSRILSISAKVSGTQRAIAERRRRSPRPSGGARETPSCSGIAAPGTSTRTSATSTWAQAVRARCRRLA